MPLQIIRQDITKMRVDAIVNTTNEEMIGYSGIDFAIHKIAGPELDIECQSIAPLGLGTAKITKGYNLNCKYIIHTSGPVWQGGLNAESIILKSCYQESLKLAVDYGCESIAMPLISSGTYGYPKDQVLKFATRVITDFLYEHEMDVYLCVYDKASYEFSRQLYDDILNYIDDDYIEDDEWLDFACDESIEDFPISSIEMLQTKMMATSAMAEKCLPSEKESIRDYLKSLDKGFADKLFDYIDESGMTDVECYKKANISKQTFSKIKTNPEYKPSKQTAVAFAIALKLDFEQTQDLLESAGLALSRSTVFDKIIRYCIKNEIYDIFEVNEILFEFDQILLGV